MIKEFSRKQRISKEMQKKIAFILKSKIKDPRMQMMTTISEVEVSHDLAYAKVFITFLNDMDEQIIKRSIKILQKASNFIRFLLSKEMRLRIVPKLTFFYDDSLLEGMRISSLLTRIIKQENQ